MSVTHEDDLFAEAVIGAEARNQRDPRLSRASRLNEVKEERSATKAAEIGAIRSKLASSASGHIAKAADKLVANSGHLANEDWDEFTKSVNYVVRAADTDRTLGDLEQRFASQGIQQIREARTYGKGSPHSWFLDRATMATQIGGMDPSDRTASAAQERLNHYAREVAYEVDRRSDEGKRAERLLGEHFRSDDPETTRRSVDAARTEMRAMATGGGSTASASGGGGAAFVSPMWMDGLWAPFLQRSPFANVLELDDVPDYGLEVYLPQFTSDASMTQQTEGQPLSESDPASALLSTQLVTISGKLTPSQQLFDRAGGPDGYGFDRIAAKQLALDFSHQLDVYSITTAIAAGGTVSYNAGSFALAGTSGVGGFVDKLSSAKNNVRGTGGSYLEPSAVFFTPARWEYIGGWADAQGRPVLLPHMASADGRQYGDTGLEWGGLHVYTSPNIPSLGTTSEDQAIVLDPSEVYLWRTPTPIIQVSPQPGASNLQVLITARGYAGQISRYPQAVQSISGTGMSPVTF